MISQILSAIGNELVESPLRIIAEVSQFLILFAIIWVVAIGFGKRRGFVANMLSERRQQVRAQLDEAQGAEARLSDATSAAAAREAAAAKEAERLLAEARSTAAESSVRVHAETDAEAERIVERARTALANERTQMQADLSEQLVDLVSQATRSIMNEKLTVAEQRARIEEAITAGVAAAAQPADSGRQRVRARPPRAAVSTKAD